MRLIEPQTIINEIVLYAVDEGTGITTIKTTNNNYVCNCDSLLEECDHIVEFKAEEVKHENKDNT